MKKSSLFFLIVLAFLCLDSTCCGELVAGLVLPHGDFAYDPTLLQPLQSPERQAAEEVSQAARIAGKWLREVIDPDIIILSTPHGHELLHDFAIYLNSYGSGYVNLGQDLYPRNKTREKFVISPRYPLETKLSNDLILTLKESSNVNITGILSFADSEDMALRWGEVIPLLLISEHIDTNTNFTNTLPSRSLRNSELSQQQHGQQQQKQKQTKGRQRRHVILSHPTRRYVHSGADMVDELLDLGSRIGQWAELQPERIALVISSDLAHTHLSNGPYGYSSSASPFDDAIGTWAHDPIQNKDWLVHHAKNLVKDALSCGYTGLVMLHEALYGTEQTNHNTNFHKNKEKPKFRSKVLANRNATYYGMMVAIFSPELPMMQFMEMFESESMNPYESKN